MNRLAIASGETFRLMLGMAAPLAELEAWMASASAGEQAVYASGLDLPRAADGVVLARRWEGEGLVTLAQRRDPDNARRWQWIMEKVNPHSNCPSPHPGKGAPEGQPVSASPGAPTSSRQIGKKAREERERLLDFLRDCAVRRKACPSDNALAAKLALGAGNSGRCRANYLMRLLAADGAISVEYRGRNAPRVVTITAEGRARGKATAVHLG